MNDIGAAESTVSDRDLTATMLGLGRAARHAQRVLAIASSEAKNAALRAAATRLRAATAELLAANARDCEAARTNGANAAYLDRLSLDERRIEAIAQGLEAVADLPDPVGAVTERWQRPNGLRFERVRTPLGVIGIIFESRPNVAADAGSLCLKSGNAAILRAGSDSLESALVITRCLANGLAEAGLPAAAIQIVPVRDRAAVGLLLGGLDGSIDVIVPRGGKGLVGRVEREARVPVFSHLDGVNHVYVHAAADLTKAKAVVLNAKLRRTGVCGAAECLLVDRDAATTLLPPLAHALIEGGCELRGDKDACALVPGMLPASDRDWGTEFLAPILAVRLVDGLEAAVEHIERYGSRHTDAIITEDERIAETFLTRVDSAIVLHNASTQFADGGEFGFGAEIGIATGRLHARGPVGLEQLTTFKYRVRGDGTVRP